MSHSVRRFTLAVIAIALVPPILGGCSNLGQLLDFNKPSATLSGVRFSDVGLQSAKMLFDIDVHNPYSFDLVPLGATYALSAAGKPDFLTGDARMDQSIPAGATKTVTLPAAINFANLLATVPSIKAGSVIPYDARLGLSFDAGQLGRLTLPLNKSGQLPIPLPPDIQVSSIDWKSLTADQASGVAHLKASNPNQFALTLSKVKLALSLAGLPVADSTLDRSIALDANGGEASVDLPIAFSPQKLGLAAMSLLTGKSGAYGLSGDMTAATPFGPMSFPLDTGGSASFFRK